LSKFRIPALPPAASEAAVGTIHTLLVVIAGMFKAHVTLLRWRSDRALGLCQDGAKRIKTWIYASFKATVVTAFLSRETIIIKLALVIICNA